MKPRAVSCSTPRVGATSKSVTFGLLNVGIVFVARSRPLAHVSVPRLQVWPRSPCPVTTASTRRRKRSMTRKSITSRLARNSSGDCGQPAASNSADRFLLIPSRCRRSGPVRRASDRRSQSGGSSFGARAANRAARSPATRDRWGCCAARRRSRRCVEERRAAWRICRGTERLVWLRRPCRRWRLACPSVCRGRVAWLPPV